MAVVNATDFPYDLVNITGDTGNILEFVRNVNNAVDQTFMLGILFAGFVILFTSMRFAGNRDAMIASSFIITVLGIFFRALDFIDNGKLIIIIVVFMIIFVASLITKQE